MFNVSSSWSSPIFYSKILDISSNKGSQKERIIKTGNNNGGCIAILWARERELMWR